jgi:hypothetical protein
MSALIVVMAALAAQAATTGSSTAPTDTAEGPKAGQTSYVDVEAGAGYATNPLLSLTSDGGRAFGRIALHAVHTRISARSTTVVSGYAENVTYTSRYGSQQSLAFYARHDTAVSEKLRLFGDLNATYSKGGQLDTRIVGVPDVPPLPGTPGTPPELLPPGSDFLSVTGKQYLLSAHAGGQLAVSARDNLTISSGVERVVFHGLRNNTSYTTIPVSVGYDRQFSPRTTIGARVVAQDTEYNGPAKVRTITPQLTGQFLLSERMTLSGAVGASFAHVDDGLMTQHSTGLSAEADLCQRGERGQFCARAAVDQQTATTAGPAKSVSAGVDYSRRLDADSTVQFSLNADRYSSPISVVSGQTFSRATYYRAAAAYTRRISDRWFGGVNLAARKLTESGPDPKADLDGSLFIRYRFGDAQ